MASQFAASRLSRPRSFLGLDEFLRDFQPPTEIFDPNGTWEHRYRVCVVRTEPKKGWLCQSSGALGLRRKPANGDTFRLEVSFGAIQGGNVMDRLEAQLTCKADRPGSLLSWERRSLLLDRKGDPVADILTKETGKVAQGVVRRQGIRERRIRVRDPVTCNWCLFDAVQRLPFHNAPFLNFTMLEELDLLRPNQRLAYRQTIVLELGGRRVRLHGFEQFGEGILPYTYWLDEQHRVLFAIGGLRAYLFDPKATLPEVRL